MDEKPAPGLKTIDQTSEGAKNRLDNRMKNDAPSKPLVILPFESTLAYVFKGVGGKETAVNAARMIENEDERLKRFVYGWDSANLRDRDSLRLEDLCAAADITPDEFLGMIVPALWRRNVDIGKLMHAMAHPQIVEASIAAATDKWGTQDRQMLHTVSGFLPTKAGMQINIDNSKKTLMAGGRVQDTSAPGLPSFEQDSIEGAEVLRGDVGKGNVRLLPARESQAVQVPGESTEPEQEILEAEFVPSPEN